MPLLEIKNLAVEFASGDSVIRVVDDVSLSLEAGRTLCLVGESGSGKSITALSIARLLPGSARTAAGQVLLNGRDVLRMEPAELRAIRGGVVSYVFQDPATSLNPVMRIGTQIKEALRLHQPERATDAEAIRLLKLVGMPAPELRARDYPFQMSGGMQQRAMIAMALAPEPKLLVADEPTTALDVTIQAQILELLRELQRQLGMAVLLITHNLGIVGDMADEVAVMYAGQIVELSEAASLVRQPLHPYTRALLDSVPRLGAPNSRLASIPGNVPQPGQYPRGCRFYDRCPTRRPECATLPPELRKISTGRSVRCAYVS
jgi:oligopeptide/dipeptide ABC transporter ATP-binding protein